MIPGIVAGASVPAPTDPYFANVISLLHFDGTNGSTTITDEKGLSWSVFGNAKLDTAAAKFGPSSLLLDGSGDRLQTADSSAWHFGTGDFTIEGWLRVVNLTPAQQFILCKRTGFTSNHAFSVLVRDDGDVVLQVTPDGVNPLPSVPSPVGIVPGTFQHFAAMRNGTSLVVALDGVLGTPAAIGTATVFAGTSGVAIGSSNPGGTPAEFFNGRLDDVRVTKGIARYTSNFTPPTRAFPNS